MSPERSFERIGGGLNLSGQELLNPPAHMSIVVLKDLDNTIFNTGVCGVNAFKKLLIEQIGNDVDLNLGSEYTYKWNQLKDWAIDRGVSDTDARELEKMVWSDIGLYQIVELLEGASDMAEWLVDKKIDFRFHTSRQPSLRAATHRNIKDHFPDIYSPVNIDIRLSDDEDRSSFKPKNTIRWVKEYGRAVFIDDSLHDTENILRATQDLEVYGIFVHHKNVIIDDYLMTNDHLIVIPGDFNKRGLWGVYEYLTGLAAPVTK